jgi:hypothetical protein
MTQLTVSDRFKELDGIVQKGLGSFLQVGMALAEIRDQRLYKPLYHSFESYCQDRCAFGRRRADQLIQAAQESQNLKSENHGSHFPENERQARAERSSHAEKPQPDRLTALRELIEDVDCVRTLFPEDESVFDNVKLELTVFLELLQP